MANLRSFTGFLALDALGTQNVAPGLSFAFPGTNPLDIIIQDGDALLEGDSGTNEQSTDPEGDQIGFITNSDGEALLDGQEIFVETSFTFTLDGAGSFTGYVLENEGSGQSFIVLPPNLAAGTIEITATDDNVTAIDYALLGSGDEEINQNDFSDLDLSGADTINAGGGDDSIDAGEGDDSVSAGDGGDTVLGNAGGDTVDGGAGDDSIRGDSGEDGITAVRESFNWAELGLNNGETIPNNANGIDQDTGNITVNFDYTELARFEDVEYRNTFAQNTDGIDTGGETIGNDIGFLVGDDTSAPGDTTEVNFNFSANTAGFEDEVRNVQFRINDVDDLDWRDIVEVNAFDANGDPVHVVLTGGSNITLTDTDGVNGLDTAIANNTNTNNQPIDASNSLFIEIPGPVASISIVYGNLETGGQRVDVTDIFFDAIPTAIANVETGDDSLLGGSGDDTIFGEAGEDTIDGGTDDDSVEGGAGDDLLQLNDNFGNDTITGGEIGETTGDTLDGGALTEAVNVVYSGDEEGDALNSVTGDSAAFSEIEHINTGSGDDTIDGTLDTVGIDLNAGAGDDTILGGQAGDTLNAGSGDDTIDGQAGVDTISAGDGDDEIQLTNGFDDDSIIGGEGGETTGDTVSGATLTEDVVVTYDGDESGNFVGQTSGDNAAFDEIEGVTTGSGDDTVDASADSSGQIITTNAGTDTILGGQGGDTIDAGADDDTVDGGAGSDSIAGGSGDDGILGGAGADTIAGGTGNDTIDGGIEADSINGGDDQDLINLTGNFGDDTIAGGEGGTDGDTLDGGTLTEDINVLFDGDESGNFTGQATGSDAEFSEIEAINTGSGDDTVDASADSVGTTINTGAGTDTVLGGAGGDTLTTGTGADTVDGGAGADSINAGDGDDELRINDGFGNDTIIAGEGGETNGDTLAGGGLTEDVTVTFTNDEDGTVTNDGGDNASFVEIERVETGSGEDTIDATASTGGVDVDSGEGADTITGGSGADTLASAGGADTINGGAGDDSITAGDGDDVIQLTPGYDNDTIVGGEGGETNGDTLDGSTLAEDVVVTYDGDEQGNFVGQNTGDDADFAEIEAINTGSGDDTIDASGDNAGINVQTNAGEDSVLGGGGDDLISTGAGEDTIDGGLGADTITAGDGDDLINLTGNFGDDSITGGEGGETNGDTLDGSTLAEDVVVTYNGDEAGTLTGQATGSAATFEEIEALNTGSGDDTVDASADTVGVNVNTNAGDDTVLGGTGDDTLVAGAGDDTVDGGEGADSITGSDGDDELRINDQFGDDTIIGGEAGETNGDTLAGGGLTEDVTVTFNNDGESGTVTNPGGDNANFAEIEAVETGSGDDTIDASGSPVGVNVDSGAGDDTITGGTGDDTFAAGAGDDTVAAGEGADSITAGDGDDDIQLTDNFGDDTIVGGEGGETDGDEIDASAVTEPVTVLFDGDEQGTITGDNTGDQANFEEIEEITTGSGDDTVDATADTVGVTINTGAGDDTVLGGQGGDTLNTGTGQDTVNGGAGADSINAGDDEDSIVLTDGFGDDTIAGGEGGTDADTLDGGALTENVDVSINADGESGTVTNPGGDNATFSEIEAINTGSGDDTVDASAANVGVNVDTGAGEDTVTGGTGDDTLVAGAGDDTVDGGEGADSITGGDGDDELRINDQFGDDTIIGGEAGETNGDTLAGGGLTEDVTVTFNNDGESGTVTNPGGDNANFAEIEAVETGSGDDTIDASGSPVGVNVDSGAGDDTITGGTGDDTFAAGAGDDTVAAGEGADSITAGDGDDDIQLTDNFGDDTIVGGEGGETNGDEIDASAVTEPVTVLFDGDEQGTISGDNTGDQANFEEIEEITTGSGDDTVDATADTVGVTINTGAGDDTVLGGQGGDTLNTGTGQDTVNGGAGADSINAGDDEDSIVLTDGFGDDTIAGGEGGNDDDTLAGGALTEAVTVTFNADDESGTVTNPGGDSATFSEIEAVETGSGDDTIDGSASTGGINVDSGAGDDTMSGGAGDDTLAAGDGADTVNGGLGADSITGGDGDDELQITDMFGDDTIVGGEGGETNGDTLAGGGLTEDVTVTFNPDGESGTVTNPGGDTANFAEIEAVETGSGDDTIDASGSPVGVNVDTGAGDDTITGGDGDDTFAGGAGDDTIVGGLGADSIDGGEDDDSLLGGEGADTIAGGDGADTIDGGEDDDLLSGGDEDDLFIYMAGQGDDTISDFNFGNTGALGDGDPTNNDFIDLTDFYTDLTEARADIADDGILNQSVGDFGDNTALDGSITLAGVTPGGLTSDNTGLNNIAGDFPHIVQGADGGAGVNQDGDNVFDDGRFYVEFIDNTGATTELSDLGFDTMDGSLGTAEVYNAGTTDDLDITNQTGTFGNDGEQFGARITTTLDVTTGGTYTFSTTSDDGSILFINGTQVVNNDGLQSANTASGTIDLDPGQFEITVLYFENTGSEELSATIQGPDYPTAISLNDPSVAVQANAGAETVSGGAGDDTFQAGVGDDVLFGDEDEDLFIMTDGFDSDTITGGEGGTDSDSIDGSALSSGVNVVFSGDEEGTFSDPFDTAIFSEIENLTLTAQDDTLDAANDTVGVNVLAGAGDDSLLGGTGGDTIAGEAGQDTLAGEAGADSLTGGDDEDTFIINDQFGDDTIVGGEGGTDSDTLEGSALTENVNILFDGDEQGNVTNPGGDNADFSEIEAIRTGSGQDTIDASADSVGTDIDSGAGDDIITGGAGQDTLVAGDGDDTVFGGDERDSIDGGADDDVLDGGNSTDTIFGGDGNDSITDTGGALSDDTIFGGAGDDTIDGGTREDAIEGGDGDDLINLTGVFGDDTIVGGEAGETNGDTVSGSTLTEDVVVTFDGDEQGDFVSQDGNGSANFEEIEAVETGLGDDTVDATLDTTGVTIITNEGEDVITGGAGDDSIDAGDDDDTITFGQNDTVLGGAGADEFIIQPTTSGMGVIGDFDPSTNVDNNVIFDPDNPPNQDDNDFVDLSGFFDNINELRDANTPNADGDVVLDLGDGQTLTFVGVSDVSLLNFENTNVICFTRGAKIRTVNGDVAVEDLVAGDLVETMDSGAQPIRWIGRRIISAGMLDATPRLRPVRIAKGALGASRDLMVSPQHRMLLSGERAEMMFGTDQVLAAAKDLVDGDMIHMGPADDVEYFHILFDDHEIIFAENVPTESFHPGEQALNTTTAKMQAEIFELFPELAEDVVNRPTARMVLKSHEAKALVK